MENYVIQCFEHTYENENNKFIIMISKAYSKLCHSVYTY